MKINNKTLILSTNENLNGNEKMDNFFSISHMEKKKFRKESGSKIKCTFILSKLKAYYQETFTCRLLNHVNNKYVESLMINIPRLPSKSRYSWAQKESTEAHPNVDSKHLIFTKCFSKFWSHSFALFYIMDEPKCRQLNQASIQREITHQILNDLFKLHFSATEMQIKLFISFFWALAFP